MGIPSLNSAILYIVSLYFHCHRFLHSLRSVEMTRVHPIRMTGYHLEQSSHCYLGDRSPLSFLSLLLKRQADYERASYCHFERAKRVEKSKSRKYNKYPGPRPRKHPFLWTESSYFRSYPRKRPFLWTGK